MTIINPATEDIIAELPEENYSGIEAKLHAARVAQVAWQAKPISERLACLERFYALLDTEKETLAATLTSEVGKPLREARNEIQGARGRIAFFLSHSARVLQEEWMDTEGTTREKITYEPLGVIANISAWNYPYLVGVNVFVPALIGGNAVLYKPSEYATLTGLHIARLLHQAGVPEGVFQTIAGGAEAGAALLALPLDGYFFTGSYATGRRIAESVAPKLVPCQLELGGKDPLYVMEDVTDVHAAAAAVLEGFMYNAGQSCCAVERVYVHERIHDALVGALAVQAAAISIGDPMDADTGLGPLSRKAQLVVLQEQVADAVRQGGSVAFQSIDLPTRGYYFPITIITGAHHGMRLMTEESFGPVIGIQSVKDDAEAIRLMKDTPYGLTAAVYGTDFTRAEAIMQQMPTGTVYWNCCDRVSANLPWSGRGHSGLGSTLGYAGIRAFVQPKAWHLRNL